MPDGDNVSVTEFNVVFHNKAIRNILNLFFAKIIKIPQWGIKIQKKYFIEGLWDYNAIGGQKCLCQIKLFVNLRFDNQIVQQGLDGQAGNWFDACFADDVLAVSDYGVNRDIQFIGNLLVCQAFHKGDEDVGLTIWELDAFGFVLS